MYLELAIDQLGHCGGSSIATGSYEEAVEVPTSGGRRHLVRPTVRLSQFASSSRSLLLLKSRLVSQLPVDEFRLRMGCR